MIEIHVTTNLKEDVCIEVRDGIKEAMATGM